MKIALCGSMAFSEQIAMVRGALERMGHVVFAPEPVGEESTDAAAVGGDEAAERKIRHDLIRRHWENIKEAEAILVLNYEKDGVPNYIGGNSFLEMGFAHVLGKKIYVLCDVPEMPYKAEILAMRPISLRGNLSELKD